MYLLNQGLFCNCFNKETIPKTKHSEFYIHIFLSTASCDSLYSVDTEHMYVLC